MDSPTLGSPEMQLLVHAPFTTHTRRKCQCGRVELSVRRSVSSQRPFRSHLVCLALGSHLLQSFTPCSSPGHYPPCLALFDDRTLVQHTRSTGPPSVFCCRIPKKVQPHTSSRCVWSTPIELSESTASRFCLHLGNLEEIQGDETRP